MPKEFNIRLAEERDYAGMLAIYSPYVINTSVTFEYQVPTLEEYTRRMAGISAHYPCLVCEYHGQVAGFAYASTFRVKKAYQWSAETTIYVADNFKGAGVARALYEVLLSVLELQGFINIYAVVTVPNERSERFHSAMGFAEIGLFENAGFKQGKWHSLKFYEMYLKEHTGSPAAPVSVNEISTLESFDNILATANEALNPDWKN